MLQFFVIFFWGGEITLKIEINGECRVLNKTKTSKYFFTEVRGKAICLVCGEQMVVFKDLIQHYETEHTEKNKNFIDAEQERTSKPFPAKLQKQQGQQVLHIQGWSAQDQLCDFQQNYTKY